MDLEALKAAIAAVEAGEEGAEAKLEEAISALGGEGGGEPAPGEGAPEGEGAVAGEDPDNQFAPSMDKFHGYDAEMAGQAFAANPQQAFGQMAALIGALPTLINKQLGGLANRVKSIQQRNELDDMTSQFAAARTEFGGFLASEEMKNRLFDANAALSTFDACQGHPATVANLKKMLLTAPLRSSITPAGYGQVFSADTAGPDGVTVVARSATRPIMISEIIPGMGEDSKMNSFADKLAARYAVKSN